MIKSTPWSSYSVSLFYFFFNIYTHIIFFQCMLPWSKALFTYCIHLLNGGWVPETSRSFHYWQPACRWRLLPWLTKPGNRAMSPHTEGEPGARHTELAVERGREGRGNAWRSAPMQNNAYHWRYHCESCQHISVQEHMETWCKYMYISQTLLTTTGMQALFVSNSVKLLLAALNPHGDFRHLLICL